MHIVMITASLPPLPAGGAELQALKLGAALTEKGASVSYVTPGKGSVRGRSEFQGMPVLRLNSVPNRLFHFWASLRKKAKTARSPTVIEYDDTTQRTSEITGKVGWPTVIYYNIFFWHCLAVLWPRRKTFHVLHAHTMEWSAIVAVRLAKWLDKPVLIKDSTMNGFRSLRRFPDGAAKQQEFIRQAYFIAMTSAIRENLKKEGVPGEKIFGIFNGIVIEDMPAPKAPASTGTQEILFVGNLYQQPAKGIDILLKAWSAVAARHPNAYLTIVGDGDLPAYTAYAAKLGIDHSIHFAGKQSALQSYYNSSSLFVLPSRREGMSNALMEAMLHALPCVATDISGNQDLIKPGINGLLVPAAAVTPLAEAICYMLEHPAEAQLMGAMARTTILREADIRVIADHYLNVYRRLTAD